MKWLIELFEEQQQLRGDGSIRFYPPDTSRHQLRSQKGQVYIGLKET